MKDLSIESVQSRIYFIRGQRVMLDSDLAILYDVETFNLNKAVQRNLKRFPRDFMFQLSVREFGTLKFQIGMSKARGRGGRRTLPLVFTEQGVAMLSGILHSNRAVDVNIAIMRAFVRMRRLLSANHNLSRKLEELENKLIAHDYQIDEVMQAIRRLMDGPQPPIGKIGY